MTSALKLKPDKELAKLVGRHIICTEKARRRKKEQSLVRNITLSLPFMVWLHGSNVVHNPRGWGWVGRLVQGCGRALTTTPIYSLDSHKWPTPIPHVTRIHVMGFPLLHTNLNSSLQIQLTQ